MSDEPRRCEVEKRNRRFGEGRGRSNSDRLNRPLANAIVAAFGTLNRRPFALGLSDAVIMLQAMTHKICPTNEWAGNDEPGQERIDAASHHELPREA
jgi:hypothetical protein